MLGPINMQQFNFATEKNIPPITIFNGPVFYNENKNADFLRVDANVEMILSRGYEIRQMAKSIPIGDTIVITGMNLRRDTPLTLKRTGKGATVQYFEFTFNRLQGLVAAYAYENRQRFPLIDSSDAKSLGLVWDNANDDKCKLYLSALSGTDHMIDQFSYLPFLCGIRKFQLNKMPLEFVVSMGIIKNNEGVTMSKLMYKNMVTAKRFWMMFPGTTIREFETLIKQTPKLKELVRG